MAVIDLPIIKNFDASKDLTIYYNFIGGMVRGSRAVLYKMENNVKTFVASDEVNSLKMEHTINAQNFENGNNYVIDFSVIYIDENNVQYESYSVSSNIFSCVKEPTIIIEDLDKRIDNFLPAQINNLQLTVSAIETNWVESYKILVYLDKDLKYLYTKTETFKNDIKNGETVDIQVNRLGFQKFKHKIERYYFVVEATSKEQQKILSPIYPVVINYCKQIAPFQAEQDDGHINLMFGLYDNIAYFKTGSQSHYDEDIEDIRIAKNDELICDLTLEKDFTICFNLLRCEFDEINPIFKMKTNGNDIYLIPELYSINIANLSDDSSIQDYRLLLISNGNVLAYSNVYSGVVNKIDNKTAEINQITVIIRRKDGLYDVVIRE